MKFASMVFLFLPTYLFALKVGVGVVDISPQHFETWDTSIHKKHTPKDGFYDTGIDQKFDFEEAGAFGLDNQPGRAGVDDDQDGFVDNCTRQLCLEYLSTGSDDLIDPHQDNFNENSNPDGTEKDKKFQWVYLGGFGPYISKKIGSRFASGIHDPIWARSVAITTNDRQSLVLTSTDLPGLTWKYINPVRRKISLKYNIPFENIIITSTHNHAAPDAAGYWSLFMRKKEKKYTEQLQEHLIESIEQALNSQIEASMKIITTEHDACYDPVTFQLKKLANCKLPKQLYGKQNPKDVFDKYFLQIDMRDPFVGNPYISALQFISTHSQKTIATVINWNNHPDTLGSLNTQVSSDFPHYIRQYVEKFLGGKAVYFSGTLGNQVAALRDTAAPYWNENFEKEYEPSGKPKFVYGKSFDHIRSIGYEIGSLVVSALNNEHELQNNPGLFLKSKNLDIKITNVLHLVLWPVWFKDIEKGDHMKFYFPGCLLPYGCVRTDVSKIQLGNLTILTAPGEIDPSYFLGRDEIKVSYKKSGKHTFPALKGFKEFIPTKHSFMLGQANNYLSYLIHSKDFHGQFNLHHPNHYEDMVTVGKNFGDDTGNALMEILDSNYRY